MSIKSYKEKHFQETKDQLVWLIKSKKIKVVLFDFGGVIFNTKHDHINAWNIFCREIGITLFNEDIYNKYLDGPFSPCFIAFMKFLENKKMIPDKLKPIAKLKTFIDPIKQNVIFNKLPREEQNVRLELLKLRERLEEIYKEISHDKKIDLILGIKTFIIKLKSKYSINTAIVTTGKRLINEYLEMCGLSQYIDIIVSSHDVNTDSKYLKREIIGKPSADLWLEAYFRLKDKYSLDIQPENCIIFDNNPKNIRDIKRDANMFSIGVATKYDIFENTDEVIDDFRNIYI